MGRYLVTVILLISLLPLSGCLLAVRGGGYQQGPPAHAPAYGHRAKHHYRYHPNAEAYFDVDRSVWFYLNRGSWTMAVELPSALRLRLGNSVALELEGEQPYRDHARHRKQYPPGQLKKKDKKHGKKKGHDRWEDD